MATEFLKGIDVSHRQGAVDWQKVAATGVLFALAKATEGADVTDERFTANYQGMKKNAIIPGAYHYYHPSTDAIAQADNFLSVVGSLSPGDLPPALDIEVDEKKSADEIIAGLKAWIEHVEQSLGKTPVIYTNVSFWNSQMKGRPDFSGYSLWIAHYTAHPLPTIPTGFTDFKIWQYSQEGVIDGIKGKVDLDRFNGTLDDLKTIAGLV